MHKVSRTWVRGLALVAAAASVTFVSSAGAASVETSSPACGSLVGAWKVVDDNTHETFLGTYNGAVGGSEGTVTFTSPNNTTTASHGQWKRTGTCTYADTDVAFLIGADGKANQTITFQAKIKVNTGANDAVFDFAFEIKNLDGTSVFKGASTGKGTRIVVIPRTS
jgi:hypothetical protein